MFGHREDLNAQGIQSEQLGNLMREQFKVKLTLNKDYFA